MRAVAVFFVLSIFCVISAFGEEEELWFGKPKIKCTKPNTVWTSCAASCERHCNKFDGKKCGRAMTLQCLTNTCVCKEGTARIQGSDNCVPIDSEECGGLYNPMTDPNATNF